MKLANNRELGVSLDEPEDAARRGRYRDDLDLLLADIAIAQGRRDEAVDRITRVRSDPSCPIAEMWARIGSAELDRLGDHREAAAEAFAALADDAHGRGATWLELQAVAGSISAPTIGTRVDGLPPESAWPMLSGQSRDVGWRKRDHRDSRPYCPAPSMQTRSGLLSWASRGSCG